MSENDLKIIESMEIYGGSFVKALAECFRRADHINFKILQHTFFDYWKEYEVLASNKLSSKRLK